MFGRALLRELATAEQPEPVLSLYALTDPRDPANTSASPAWQIEVRNGLGRVAERLEAGGAREERLAFRALSDRIEAQLVALEPAERGRSVAWFVRADGTELCRLRLQLPLRSSLVVWDAKPFISSLVDLADRGAPTGVVLASSDSVRLLEIEQGEAREPEHSMFEIEVGDWRPFGGTAGGSAERGRRTTSHEERYEARVEVQRDRLFESAARATASRLGELGWERVVLVSERAIARRFGAVLPDELRSRVVAETELNLAWEPPHAIAEALEPTIEQAWRARASGLADLADEQARAGGPATLGVDQTLAALAEGRVARLVLDPAQPFAATRIPEAVGGPAELLGERAVEAAIATSADVTSLAVEMSESLRAAGGMAALLRY